MKGLHQKTYQDIKKEYRLQLEGLYPIFEIDSIFYLVLEHISGKKKTDFMIEPNFEISEDHQLLLTEALQKLKQAVPVQYVIREAWFMDQRFEVSPDVLIPRPETEEILYTIKERLSAKPFANILDIGTGSGCIAISLASIFPKASVYGIDISEKALAIAAKNAKYLKVNVHWKEADILGDCFQLFSPHSLDLIVSNPPYVRQLEIAQMHDNVLKHEPYSALFVPDDKALLFYEAITEKACKWLKPEGILVFEINEEYGAQIITLLKSSGFYPEAVMKDFKGKDRCVWAVKAP